MSESSKHQDGSIVRILALYGFMALVTRIAITVQRYVQYQRANVHARAAALNWAKAVAEATRSNGKTSDSSSDT